MPGKNAHLNWVLLAFTLVGWSPAAQATLITPDNSWNGQTVVTTGGAVFTAYGGLFTYTSKCPGCLPGVGINNIPVGDEIDANEFMTISFAQPVHITQLVLGYVYKAGQFDYADKANETIAMIANLSQMITFTATGSTTGTLTGPGTYYNLSPAETGYSGAWVFENPFGAELVSHIELRPYPSISACDPKSPDANISTVCSDFTFNGLSTNTPEPGTVGLIGLGLGLVALASRRLRR